MIKHYFESAIRNILRQKLFSAINIIGLTISLLASFLILLYVVHEFSYDQHHKNKDDIYRILTSYTFEGGGRTLASVNHKLGVELQKKFPEIQLQTSVINFGSLFYRGVFIHQENGNFQVKDFLMVDSSFFKIFTISILAGNVDMLYNGVNSIFVSQSFAIKYFGHSRVVGEVLELKNKRVGSLPFTIAGVFEDIEHSSSINANIIGNIEHVHNLFKDDDRHPWSENYLLVNKNTDIKMLSEKINEYANKEFFPNNYLINSLQALNDIYFHSAHISQDSEFVKGNLKNIYIFSFIAIAILLVGCINYILMSTANSNKRLIEIGIRKTLGASRMQLFVQIFIESLLVCIVAFFTAIVLSEIFLPSANKIFAKELYIDYLKNWEFIVGMLIITLFVTTVSGIYISVYLSKFEVIKVLKNQFIHIKQKSIVRKTLIGFQLVVFVTLIICTSIISKQINFAQNKELGFERKNLIRMRVVYGAKYIEKNEVFLNEIKANSQIISASGSYGALSEFNIPRVNISTSIHPEEIKNVGHYGWREGFIETTNMRLLKGRDFIKGDSLSLILNETAVKELALENPLEESILMDNKKYRVIGIVKDFNIESVYSKIPAIIISYNRYMIDIVVRIREENTQQAISFLEMKWKEIYEKFGDEFEYYFVDQIFRDYYKVELNFGKTIQSFTILSIIIAFLGLFGLSTFLAKQKTKEIGIRKVFGASIYLIIRNISKDLLILTIIANLIAWPISWYIMDSWLQNFAYKIEMPFEIFVITGLVTIVFVIAILTLNSYSAAKANIVSYLQYE